MNQIFKKWARLSYSVKGCSFRWKTITKFKEVIFFFLYTYIKARIKVVTLEGRGDRGWDRAQIRGGVSRNVFLLIQVVIIRMFAL